MKKILAIFICAFLGSGLRLALTSIGSSQHFLTIMVINVIGCFLLPLVTGALPLILPVAPHIVTGLSVGLVGSFTTFSTFSVDTLHLLQQHTYGAAACYLGGTLILGWLAASWSLRLTKLWLKEDRDL